MREQGLREATTIIERDGTAYVATGEYRTPTDDDLFLDPESQNVYGQTRMPNGKRVAEGKRIIVRREPAQPEQVERCPTCGSDDPKRCRRKHYPHTDGWPHSRERNCCPDDFHETALPDKGERQEGRGEAR